MHQSIAGLPQRVLIDTNVLLNACFVRDCSARSAISRLAELGYQPIVDGSIERESVNVLSRLKIKCGLDYDPASLIPLYLASAKILSLPAAPFIDCLGVNKADRYVYSAARFYGAWLLTGDVQFMTQSASQGVAARVPLDVLMEFALRAGQNPPLHYLMRYAGICRDQGSVFARVLPGHWAGVKGIGLFTVCEIENVLTLAYDSARLGWVLSIRGGGEGFASFPVKHGDQLVVSGSFEISQDASRGNASLRAYSSDGAENAIGFELSGGPSAVEPGKVAFLHNVNCMSSWSGPVRCVVVSPRQMSVNTWKALKINPDSTPDPASGNILEAALRKIRVVSGSAYLPVEAQIGREWV
jgi:hypothetical protein